MERTPILKKKEEEEEVFVNSRTDVVWIQEIGWK